MSNKRLIPKVQMTGDNNCSVEWEIFNIWQHCWSLWWSRATKYTSSEDIADSQVSQSCLTLMDGWMEKAETPEHNCYPKSTLWEVLVTEKLQMRVPLSPLQKACFWLRSLCNTIVMSRKKMAGCHRTGNNCTATPPTVHKGLNGSWRVLPLFMKVLTACSNWFWLSQKNYTSLYYRMVSLDLPLRLLSALQNLFNADETKKTAVFEKCHWCLIHFYTWFTQDARKKNQARVLQLLYVCCLGQARTALFCTQKRSYSSSHTSSGHSHHFWRILKTWKRNNSSLLQSSPIRFCSLPS